MTARRWLWALWTLLLILKLALLVGIAEVDPASFHSNDTPSYWIPAEALLETGKFAPSVHRADEVETLRTPGYPLFLVAVFSIFGTRPVAVLACQIVLSWLAMVWLWRHAAARGSTWSGVRLFGFVAADVTSLAYGMKLLTEVLFTTLMVLAWWLAKRFQSEDFAFARAPVLWALALGAALGTGVLVRPVAYYLLVPMLVWVAVTASLRKASRRVVVATAMAFGVAWLALVGGWKLRNLHHTGVASLSAIEGVNLLYYRGAAIVALRDGIDMHEARTRLGKGRYQELHPETKDLSSVELSARWAAEGRALILDHPVLFVRTQVAGLGAILLGQGHHALLPMLGIEIPPRGPLGDLLRLSPSAYWQRWPAGETGLFVAFALEVGYLGFLYFGVAAWLFVAWRRREWTALDAWAFLVVFYLLAVSAGPEAHSRFRVPLMPFLAVYSAWGFDMICECRRRAHPTGR